MGGDADGGRFQALRFCFHEENLFGVGWCDGGLLILKGPHKPSQAFMGHDFLALKQANTGSSTSNWIENNKIHVLICLV